MGLARSLQEFRRLPNRYLTQDRLKRTQVLEKQKIQNHKYIVKIELKDDGDINIDNFIESKQIYFSQMNDEPMWKRIDNDTIHLVILYQSPHHTVESGWDPEDY